MIHITGIITIEGFLEGIGKVERMRELPSMLKSGCTVRSSLKGSQEHVESQCVKIRNGSSEGQLVVRIYYRPPNRGRSVDKAMLQLQQVSILSLEI